MDPRSVGGLGKTEKLSTKGGDSMLPSDGPGVLVRLFQIRSREKIFYVEKWATRWAKLPKQEERPGNKRNVNK